jgi:hypothetical protein
VLNISKEIKLSWFNRKPIAKNNKESRTYRHSPATDRLLKETKAATKPTLLDRPAKK